MPATPAANRGFPAASGSLTMADYLKAKQPTWDRVRDGLAIFAIFVIFRYLVQIIHALIAKKAQPTSSNTHLRFDSQPDRPRLPWIFDQKAQSGSIFNKMMKNKGTTSGGSNDPTSRPKLPIELDWDPRAEGVRGQFISRLPPAPPLTPPELSSAVFAIAPSQPHAIDSFIQQPNPDYMSSTASVTSQLDSAASPAASRRAASRRRSYHRMLPLGIPTSQQPIRADVDSATAVFSPSSYPPTSPHLPPPPPHATDSLDDGQTKQREMDVEGEIISALDHEGAGWTRHTRVYGGGVCLACAASGGNHGGGFYGATVTPEEMRQDAYTARSSSVFVQS